MAVLFTPCLAEHFKTHDQPMPLIAKLMGGLAALLAATFFWSFAVPLVGLIVLVAKFFAG